MTAKAGNARFHARRALRTRVGLRWHLSPVLLGHCATGAQILAALKPFTNAAFRQAHKEGRIEPGAAHAADGFEAMAAAAAAGQGNGEARRKNNNVKIIIVVDAEALRRQSAGAGSSTSVCDIHVAYIDA